MFSLFANRTGVSHSHKQTSSQKSIKGSSPQDRKGCWIALRRHNIRAPKSALAIGLALIASTPLSNATLSNASPSNPAVAPSLRPYDTAPAQTAFDPVRVEEYMKNVVTISTKVTLKPQKSGQPEIHMNRDLEDIFKSFGLFGFGQGFGHLFGKNTPGTSKVRRSLGSGFILQRPSVSSNPDGKRYVVTNCHVIERALNNSANSQVTITLDSGQTLQAKVEGADEASDIAVLSIILPPKLRDIKGLVWADTKKVRRGQIVGAAGNPFGLGGSFSVGVVSKVGRELDKNPAAEWIQTDAAVNQGNSGGPLLTVDGAVLGINTAILTPHGANAGVALAIPAEYAKSVVESLLTKGCVERSSIGVRLHQDGLKPAQASLLGLQDQGGVLVDEVVSGMPAQRAGMKTGDVIVEVAGKATQTPAQVARGIRAHAPGSHLLVRVWRPASKTNTGGANAGGANAGNFIDLRVETTRMCALSPLTKGGSDNDSARDNQAQARSRVLGLTLEPLTPAQRQEVLATRLIEPEWTGAQMGAKVAGIDPDSPVSGTLRRGDIVLRLGTQPIGSVQEAVAGLETAIKDGAPSLLVRVLRKIPAQSPLGTKDRGNINNSGRNQSGSNQAMVGKDRYQVQHEFLSLNPNDVESDYDQPED
jgi:serine protease Do